MRPPAGWARPSNSVAQSMARSIATESARRTRASSRGGRVSCTTMYVRFAPGRDATASPGCEASAGSSVGETRFRATSARPASSRSARAFSSCTTRSVTARAGRGSAAELAGASRTSPRCHVLDRVRTEAVERPVRRGGRCRLVGPQDRQLEVREERRVRAREADRPPGGPPPRAPRRSPPRRWRAATRPAGDANARSVATTSRARRGAPEWKRTSSRRSTSSVSGSTQRQALAR